MSDERLSFDKIYLLIREGGEGISKLSQCLFLQSWLNSIFEFDPMTNEPLLSSTDSLLSEIGRWKSNLASKAVNSENLQMLDTLFWWNDAIESLSHFTENAVYSVFEHMKTKIVSRHIIKDVRFVKQTDSASIRWVSKKSGRTVKQKIANDGKMMGVFREENIDTQENRLFKAYLSRLDEILEGKEMLAAEKGFPVPDETRIFSSRIRRWLSGEDARKIGVWRNENPNNTLLQDRNYKKIWKAWRDLLSLDDELNNDFNNLEELKKTCCFWSEIEKSVSQGKIKIAQTPAKLEKNENGVKSIRLYTPKFLCFENGRFAKSDLEAFRTENISIFLFSREDNEIEKCDICAFDLSFVEPKYSCHRVFGAQKSGVLNLKLVYQKWKEKGGFCDKKIDVDCSSAKLIANPESDFVSATLTIRDFFNESEHRNGSEYNENFSAAAEIFSSVLSKTFIAKKYYYLIPDNADDFSLVQTILRGKLNLKFANITPLPRSVAKIFSHYVKNKDYFLAHKNQNFFILDKFDDFWVVTRLIPKIDESLKSKYPESNGLVFERFPPIVFSNKENDSALRAHFSYSDLISDDLTSFVYENTVLPIKPDQTEIKKQFCVFDTKKENKKYIEILPDENLAIGAIAYDLEQQKTPDIPLWREHLPSLKITVDCEDEYGFMDKTEIVLVGKGENENSVQPKKGCAIPIKIAEKYKYFVLPRGSDYYEFPLIQGDGKSEKRRSYFAFLRDKTFPLKNNTKCELCLTYTYGAEHPYNLTFTPTTSSEFTDVSVDWKDFRQNAKIELPVPDFPQEKSWEDVFTLPFRQENMETLGEYIELQMKRFANSPRFYTVTEKKPYYKTDKLEFALIDWQPLRLSSQINKLAYRKTGGGAYTHTRQPAALVEKWRKIESGDHLFCCLEPKINNSATYNAKEIRFSRFKAAMLTALNNGRSFKDTAFRQIAGDDFLHDIDVAIKYAVRLAFYDKADERTVNLMKEFLCFFHKDMPREMQDDVLENCAELPTQLVGNAIGDCSQDWQEELFERVFSLKENHQGRWLAILGKCLWRSKWLVYKLSKANISEIIRVIDDKLSNRAQHFDIEEVPPIKIAIDLVSNLEVLLALLRLRNDENGNPSIEMRDILSIKKNEDLNSILNSLKVINKKILEYGIGIKTRLKIENTDSFSSIKTPPLILAAARFIEGNKNSKSIKIVSVQDEE